MEVPNAGKHATQGRESGTSFIQRVWRTTVIIGVSIMEGYDRPPAASTGRRRAAAAITGSGPIPASAALGVGPIVGPFRALSAGVGGRCREAFGPGALGSPWGNGPVPSCTATSAEGASGLLLDPFAFPGANFGRAIGGGGVGARDRRGPAEAGRGQIGGGLDLERGALGGGGGEFTRSVGGQPSSGITSGSADDGKPLGSEVATSPGVRSGGGLSRGPSILFASKHNVSSNSGTGVRPVSWSYSGGVMTVRRRLAGTDGPCGSGG